MIYFTALILVVSNCKLDSSPSKIFQSKIKQIIGYGCKFDALPHDYPETEMVFEQEEVSCANVQFSCMMVQVSGVLGNNIQ